VNSASPPHDAVRSWLIGSRRRKIAELIASGGVVRVSKLVKLSGRRGHPQRFEALAREGVLVRDHGGAVARAALGVEVQRD